MAEAGGKRKQGPGGSSNGPSSKKSKGGGQRWQTPHQKAKHAEKAELGATLEVGDAGIWVTYARGMRGKAMREFRDICNEYGETMFGVKAPSDEDATNEADEAEDIEASIEAELEQMKEKKPKTKQVFTPISTSLECLFFMKTLAPVEPVKMVRQICEDAKSLPDPRGRKCKYVNRLTPVIDSDKATEKGIERVARTVLEPWFNLTSELQGDQPADKDQDKKQGVEEGSTPYTYAIRYNIRNHKQFKSEAVIKMIASLVSPQHKVNLSNPDKVILVEIYQMLCGISVVDGKDWEATKRYNLNELYKMGSETKPEVVTEEAAKTE